MSRNTKTFWKQIIKEIVSELIKSQPMTSPKTLKAPPIHTVPSGQIGASQSSQEEFEKERNE